LWAFRNGREKESKLRRKSSVKFWLLTLTRNKMLRLVMLKTNLRKKKKMRNNSSSIKPQQKTNHRLQQVAEDYQSGDRLMEGTLTL